MIRALKIGILNNKKLILFVSVLFLASFCLLIPTSLGYGSGFSDAETKINGLHSETLNEYDDDAYYKVLCDSGDSLKVTLQVESSSYDLDIYLYDSNQFLEDSSFSTGSFEDVWGYPDIDGYYYIQIERYSPSYGDIPFTLTISGAGGITIPGFDIIALLIGVISVSGVICLQVKRKQKTTS